MSDDLVLGVINDAAKQGSLTKEEKVTIKSMLIDGNGIVLEIAEDFKKDSDQNEFIRRLKEYLKMCESDDEEQQNNKLVQQLGSPEGEMLVDIKKKRNDKKNKQKEEEVFANIEECEDGLSPKVIFKK